MVGAGDDLAPSRFGDQQGAAVTADVVKAPQVAHLVTHEEQRPFRNLDRQDVADAREIVFGADADPRTREDPLLFHRVDVGVVEHPAGQTPGLFHRHRQAAEDVGELLLSQ